MRKFYPFVFFIASLFLVVSCTKYNKMLDIDWKNMKVDGDMNWGIPLINENYTIDRILNEFGYSEYITLDPNGVYYFKCVTKMLFN